MITYRSSPSGLFVLLAGLVAACSSHGGHSTLAAPATSSPAASGDASATTCGVMWDGNPATQPCCLNTASAAKALFAIDPTKGLSGGGYPGDDVCILPPDSNAGMAFHYGPSTYDDPNEVGKYVITPGQEITDCSLFPSSNESTIYFREYHSRMRPGSHHMLLYLTPLASGEAAQTSDGPVDCQQMATRAATQQRNLFGAQQPKWDGDVAAFNAPENDGVAITVGARQQAVMQAHFINTGSTPMLREVWANILFVDKSKVTEVGDPIFFISGFTTRVPMGQTQVVTGSATVPSNVASDFRLVIATGHYHAHTARFTAYKTVNGVRDLLFEEYGQSTFQAPYTEIPPEPGNYFFTSTGMNPKVDSANHVSGGYSGALYLKPGDKIDWECEVHNNDVSSNSPPPYNAASLGWGNAVYSGEMCNMFGLYAPSLSPDTGCSWKGGQAALLNNSCP